MEETQRVTEVRRETNAVPVTPGEHPQKTYAKKKVIFRAYQVIWYVLGLIEVLLAFRFILKALAANPTSGFTNMIYTLSTPFSLPFRGIFPQVITQGSIIEWSTLVACVVYLIAAIGIIKMFQLVKPTNPNEVEREVDTQ